MSPSSRVVTRCAPARVVMVRGRGFVPALRAVPAQSGVLRPAGSGTNLTLLTHTGFYNEQSVARHEDARPAVLAHLDEQMTTTHASQLTSTTALDR